MAYFQFPIAYRDEDHSGGAIGFLSFSLFPMHGKFMILLNMNFHLGDGLGYVGFLVPRFFFKD